MTDYATMVRPTSPPSLAVEAGATTLHLDAACHTHPVFPRIDLICMRADFPEVHMRSVRGVESVIPTPPPCPADWVPLAHVHLPALAHCVTEAHITEIRP